MSSSSKLRLSVDLGVNFTLELTIFMKSYEVRDAQRINSLIKDCLSLEMPVRANHSRSIESVPEISDYLREQVAKILDQLGWNDSTRIVKSTLTAKRPPVGFEVTGILCMRSVS